MPRRDANGYRRFAPADLAMAAWTRDLIAAGFSLRELRKLSSALDQRPPKPGSGCSAMMREKIEQIGRLIDSLGARRNALSERLAALESAGNDRQGDSNEDFEDPGTALSALDGFR